MGALPRTLGGSLGKVRELAVGPGGPAERLLAACRLLRDGLDGFDWVGFYLVDPLAQGELFLGPFEGEPTEHTRIPFGRGVCGQAAEREETLVIDDVAGEPNYLACSLAVKSEIVVPVLHDGRLVGELDIDSHRAAAFASEHREFCEAVALVLAADCAAVSTAGPG